MPSLNDIVTIRQTHVGQAVFAAQDFEPEDEISQINGEVVHGEDYQSDYCIDLGNAKTLVPGEPFRFLNHSCEPNCELIVWGTETETPELWLHAIAPIAAGDELTIDYAWPADAAIPCLCKTESCRGWIVDEEELATVHEIHA